MRPYFGIGWQMTNASGWGVFGLNLAQELYARGGPEPIMLVEPGMTDSMTAAERAVVERMRDQHRDIADYLAKADDMKITLQEAFVLHSLGNDLMFSDLAESVRGGCNGGMVFFEDTRIGTGGHMRAGWFDIVLAGSTWNAEILDASGIKNVAVAIQGVNTERFFPRPKSKTYGDRFVVYSGGKMEYRKGQDIVLTAFKRFHERHPDSVLVTTWQNPWPDVINAMVLGGHVKTAPEVDDTRTIDVAAWASREGLPDGAVVDMGLVANDRMPEIFADADVALFPNRCEGGTNLVAMEAMASGVPVILSNNTGHKDLIAPGACYTLDTQSVVSLNDCGTDGWGESDVDEAVAALEAAYTDRQDANRKSGTGVARMRGWTWRTQVAKLLETVEALD